MRASERLVVFSGVVVAIVLALSSHAGFTGNAAVADGASAELRIATVDAFLLAEKVMDQREGMKSKREELVSRWREKVDAIQNELRKLQEQAQILPPSDPKFRDLSNQFQQKQQELQLATQQGTNEVDQLGAEHLVIAYEAVRDTATNVGGRLGYTLIFSSRSAERKIESTSVSATLQEMLARPILKGVEADDITAQVMTELGVK